MLEPTCDLFSVGVMAMIETKNTSSTSETNNLLRAITICINWQDV